MTGNLGDQEAQDEESDSYTYDIRIVTASDGRIDFPIATLAVDSSPPMSPRQPSPCSPRDGHYSRR